MNETLAFLHERITRRPRVMLILGSGQGALADAFDDAVSVPFEAVPGFPPPTVEGHRGRLVAGTLEGVECIALQGRYHLYEGHSTEIVTLPIRAIAALGAHTMIATNSAGGLSRAFRPGDLMLIADHVNLMGRNPLAGPVVPGDERFPDMTEAYDPELRALAEGVADDRGIRLVQGVYCAVGGPSYETPAEIRMLRLLGGDAVGMSTVPEVIVARAIGLRVLALSLITNLAAGLAPAPLHHADVIAAAAAAEDRITTLVRGILRELSLRPDIETA